MNDIGAVTFLADVRLVDLYGLASMETTNLRLRGGYTSSALDDITARADRDRTGARGGCPAIGAVLHGQPAMRLKL